MLDGLGCLARRDHLGAHRDVFVGERAFQLFEIERGYVLVRDDENPLARQIGGDIASRAGNQVVADENLVASRAQRNRQALCLDHLSSSSPSGAADASRFSGCASK
jgi:hypothetical protein